MIDNAIQNVYVFSHITGSEFYDKKPQEQSLVLVEYDDCFLLHRQRSLLDDPEVIEVDINADVDTRNNMVVSLVDLYLTRPSMR